MTKVVRVDEVTYADLISITGKMMTALEKPWSLGMTVRVAVAILDQFMNTPFWKEFLKELKKKEIPPPDEFMKRFEAQFKGMIQSTD